MSSLEEAPASRLFINFRKRETTWSGVVRVLLCGAAGLSLIAWACSAARFRNAEGWLTGSFCLPLSAGIALLLCGCASTTANRAFCVWCALLIVGQAVTLQFINAGSSMHYQHYKPLAALAAEQPLLLACFLTQAMVVLYQAARRAPQIRAWLKQNFTLWQLTAVGIVFFVTSATVSADVRAYIFELCFAAGVQAITVLNVVLAVWSLPPATINQWRQRFSCFFGQNTAQPAPRIDRSAVCAALWVVVSASVLSFFVYERHPHIPDEASYLIQAKYFAAGMLTMPAPATPDAFAVDIMTYESQRWYSPFPPGWPAMLALGTLLSAAWLVNPILAGFNVLCVFSLIKELYDRHSARLAVLLLAASPWYVFMAMNYMAHTFTLTCALTATLALGKARRTKLFWWAALAGAAVGVTSLIRPLDGFVLGAMLGLWALGVGGPRLKFLSLLGFGLGAFALGSLNLIYNKLITGSFTYFPVNAFFDKYYGVGVNALGFGPERGVHWSIDAFPGHSPLEALVNANLNIFSINIELFGWGTGSLLLCAVALFCGKLTKSDRMMVVVALVVATTYSLYWYSGGPDFGARYWYFVIIPCLALAIRGLRLLEHKISSSTVRIQAAESRVTAAVAVLCLGALVNYFPWRTVDKYHHYLGMRPDVRRLAEPRGFGRSVVLIRGEQFPDYASAAVYNHADVNASAPVFVWDRDAEVRRAVLRSFADRLVWVVNGPSLTGRGYEIVQGPLPARSLLPE